MTESKNEIHRQCCGSVLWLCVLSHKQKSFAFVLCLVSTLVRGDVVLLG